jgi:CRP/FNR family nitrogen fixation transcriptional regulator
MYRPSFQPNSIRRAPDVARSGQLDALIALDGIGVRLRFIRNQAIYAQGDEAGFWCKVVSGAVRISKLRADGRRNIAAFCFAGDAFGLEPDRERGFSAEAIGEVTLMRYPRAATERLADESPGIARHLREEALKGLSAAQGRLLILGRMTAYERVVSFLIELSDRNDGAKQIELPMSRCDIGDYLGLTIETVSRTLSDLNRRRLVAVDPHSVALIDRPALDEIAEG